MNGSGATHCALVLRGGPAELLERMLAEAFEAGASGAAADGETQESITVYAPVAVANAVHRALVGLAGDRVHVGSPEAIEARDWSEDWKRHLEIVEISARLRIRPSVVDAALEPGQEEVVVEPGQAFGTGNHESTRLALGWIEELARGDVEAGRRCHWLDVGTGSGVLAVAALRLGAAHASGCDIDPLAVDAAPACAQRNAVSERFAVWSGSLEAVPPGRFERIVANLLKREVLPLADAIAERLHPDGRLVLAGLLERDAADVLAAFARHRLAECGRRLLIDDDGESWVGLCLRAKAGTSQ